MLKFNEVSKGIVIRINTRGCELMNLPLKQLIEACQETGECLLQLTDGTSVFVKKTKQGYSIDLGEEE